MKLPWKRDVKNAKPGTSWLDSDNTERYEGAASCLLAMLEGCGSCFILLVLVLLEAVAWACR